MRGLKQARKALHPWGHGSPAIPPLRTAARGPLAAAAAAATATYRPALPTPALPAHHQQRSFSPTALCGAAKKARKAAKAAADDDAGHDGRDNATPAPSAASSAASSSSSLGFDHEAAFDLADVNAEYARIAARFEKRLQELRAGRFDPEVLGQLRVQLPAGGGGGAGAGAGPFPLRDVAAVVPRGARSVALVVSDAAFVQPVLRAVQASPLFNQQPQQDPDHALELVLRVEADDPEEQLRKLRAGVHAWRDAAREVLAARKARHARWLKAKDITRDDVKLLDRKVKALQDKQLEAIDKKEKQYQSELANKSKRL